MDKQVFIKKYKKYKKNAQRVPFLLSLCGMGNTMSAEMLTGAMKRFRDQKTQEAMHRLHNHEITTIADLPCEQMMELCRELNNNPPLWISPTKPERDLQCFWVKPPRDHAGLPDNTRESKLHYLYFSHCGVWIQPRFFFKHGFQQLSGHFSFNIPLIRSGEDFPPPLFRVVFFDEDRFRCAEEEGVAADGHDMLYHFDNDAPVWASVFYIPAMCGQRREFVVLLSPTKLPCLGDGEMADKLTEWVINDKNVLFISGLATST